MNNSPDKKRTNEGRWAKGTSGNQSGRPPGSRNKGTQLLQEMLEGEAERITRKAIDLAVGGDLTAIRLCMERLIPARKDRPVAIDLPPIQTVQQVSLAMETVSRAISEGRSHRAKQRPSRISSPAERRDRYRRVGAACRDAGAKSQDRI